MFHQDSTPTNLPQTWTYDIGPGVLIFSVENEETILIKYFSNIIDNSSLTLLGSILYVNARSNAQRTEDPTYDLIVDNWEVEWKTDPGLNNVYIDTAVSHAVQLFTEQGKKSFPMPTKKGLVLAIRVK